MKELRKLNRRSFLGRVAGGVVAGGAAIAVLGGRAEAQVTDSDSGPNADPGGRGRGTGTTDRDSGSNADAAGNGRNARATSGLTDSDSGSHADVAGNGRGRRQCSDSDSGSGSDPAGRGRRC